MKQYFNLHPQNNNMTYIHHFVFTLNLSIYFLGLSIKNLIHAINPNWFQTAAKDSIKELNSLFKHIHE